MHDHRFVRESLFARNKYKNKAIPDDAVQNNLMPQLDGDEDSEELIQDDIEDALPYRSQGRSSKYLNKRIFMPERHDFGRLHRYSLTDTMNYSRYMVHWAQTRLTLSPPRTPLPRPYYAPCLRIKIPTSTRPFIRRFPIPSKGRIMLSMPQSGRPPTGDAYSISPVQQRYPPQSGMSSVMKSLMGSLSYH